MKNIFFLSVLIFLNGCASVENINEESLLPSVHGKYGQLYVNGYIVMQTEYDSSDECINDYKLMIKMNSEFRYMLKEKKYSIFCEKFSSTTNTPYSGSIRYLTNDRIVFAKFPSKEICNIVKNENKNSLSEILCP